MSDAHERMPTKRLALHIKESVQQSLGWVVFEPSSEALWSRVRAEVETVLHALFVQGALQGSKPRDAYIVKCGMDTMTQSDIDNGRLNVEIGIAALKPAEFVIIQIQLMTAGDADDPNAPPKKRKKRKP